MRVARKWKQEELSYLIHLSISFLMNPFAAIYCRVTKSVCDLSVGSNLSTCLPSFKATKLRTFGSDNFSPWLTKFRVHLSSFASLGHSDLFIALNRSSHIMW